MKYCSILHRHVFVMSAVILAADQRLCFRYIDSTIPLLHKSEISSFYPYAVAVHPGLCRTWSETPETDFLVTRLICIPSVVP